MRKAGRILFLAGCVMLCGLGYAWAEGQCPFGKSDAAATGEGSSQTESLGAQAGTKARELRDAAAAEYATGSVKVAEAEKKITAEAQKTMQSLQQQWDAFSRQLQEKTQQIQKQLQQQWDDFNRSLNQPKK